MAFSKTISLALRNEVLILKAKLSSRMITELQDTDKDIIFKL